MDVDGTLLNTQKLKIAIGEEFVKQFGKDSASKLWDVYTKVLNEKGFVDIKEIARTLAPSLKINDFSLVENVFLDSPFRDFLFPGALAFLKGLLPQGKVLIYSQGDDLYQPRKIRESGIEEIVGKENVIIKKDKEEYFSELKKDLEKEIFSEITVIDNSPSVLESARIVFPEAKLVLTEEGKYNT